MTKLQKISQKGDEKITYWRSIDNRRRTENYLAGLENEFAQDVSDITSVDRRSMLKVMGASIALAGMGISCRRPEEKILPYSKQPEDITPGIPNFYATAIPDAHGATGVLVESHEGRPTKIEGNKSHPQSLGAAGLNAQASVLELYDPDRSRFCVAKKSGGHIPVEWKDWDSFASFHFHQLKEDQGEGLALLTNADLSPTFLRIKQKIKKDFPKAKFYVHEPLREVNREQAAALAFGKHKRVRYHLSQAQVVVSVFADPLMDGPEHLIHAKEFAGKRNIESAATAHKMNRLYAIEANLSLTGTNADHRMRLPVTMAKNFLQALINELALKHKIKFPSQILRANDFSPMIGAFQRTKGLSEKFISVVAKDLAANLGASVLIGGEQLPPQIGAMIHLINVAIAAHKKCFSLVQINDQLEKDHLDEPGLKELTMNLGKNKVKTLFMLGVNPAQTAPGSIDFAAAIKRAKVSIHAGLFNDESGKLSDWHLPLTHFLEHFSDTKSYDGTVSVIQPLIKPLHGARSALELLAQVGDYKTTKPYDMLGETWSSNSLLSLRKIIHDGVFKKSQYKSVAIPNIDAQKTYIEFNRVIVRTPKKDSLELTVKYCYKLGDGRFANNSWLQELPDPVTKMNWDNSLLMSPKAAKEHGIKSGLQKNAYVADIVKVSTKAHQIELPVFVLPGLADYCIVATMGYGRSAAGQVGNGIGVDVNKLRYSPGGYVTPGVKIERLNKTVKLSTTQEQFAMNGDTVQEQTTLSMQNRKPARDEDVATYQKSPTYAKDGGIPKNLLVKEPGGNKKVPLQMTKAWDYSKGNQWGMSIDLTKCIGCNACVTACQSENNIPVVGKEQVMRGRMMHWIRIDRYFIGDVSSPKSISQPVLCQHCENAPCEPVCPVAATSHDTEGLNVMTYNRCIGTRYCANNCPYKVRRFNYFDFTHSGNLYVDPKTKERQKTLKLQRNPDVTVRYRGVMEKCTFCTQRIQEAKMDARRKGNDPNNLPDGAVTPACAQTCPTEAIVFGNINDKNSKVAGKKRIDRDYSMLDILNTRPRITYLAKLRNPHPELVK